MSRRFGRRDAHGVPMTPPWLVAPGLGHEQRHDTQDGPPTGSWLAPGAGAQPDPPWNSVATPPAIEPAAPWPRPPVDSGVRAAPMSAVSVPVHPLAAGPRGAAGSGTQLGLGPVTPRQFQPEPAGRAVALPALRPAPSGPRLLERSVAALEPITDGEAAAFAARFAADYLSFDEDNPMLRAEVLRGYLAYPSVSTVGWPGVGRQRADIVLPGRSLRTADGAVVVEVTARVTPYRRAERTSNPTAPDDPQPAVLPSSVGRSCAPAADAPGWIAGPAQWARIAPPIRRTADGRLVVDMGAASQRSDAADTAESDNARNGDRQ